MDILCCNCIVILADSCASNIRSLKVCLPANKLQENSSVQRVFFEDFCAMIVRASLDNMLSLRVHIIYKVCVSVYVPLL